MRVLACQTEIVWENKKANFELVVDMLARKVVPENSLLVLPEMFATGFSMNVSVVPEHPNGETESFIRSLAIQFRSFAIGGLVTIGQDSRCRNQLVVYSPAGELVVRYSKIHPFTLGGEAACYTCGDEISSFNWSGARVFPFICYDLRFPEIFRSAVRSGAQLFVVVANWPVKRVGHWVTLLQARAIENQAYVVGLNRCGTDPKFIYPGRSMVVDPHGNILTQLDDKPGVMEADLDMLVVETWRRDFPALLDMHWKGV